MNSYIVFIKSTKLQDKIEDLVILKEGFNSRACLFNIFWLIFNKCYLFSIASILYVITAKRFLSTFSFNLIFVLSSILLGFEANNVLINIFKKNKNYIFVGVIIGHDENDAKKRFLEDMAKEQGEKVL